ISLKMSVSAMILAALLPGCEKAESASAGSGTNEEVVVVATSGGPRPFSFVDDDGTIAGVDVDICRAIDELLPQYRFTYEVTEFVGILGGLDAGKYQIGANSFSWTEPRAEKYIFPDPIYANPAGFIIRPGYTEIKKLEDIGGKRTGTVAGTAMATFLEGFNEKHPDNKVIIEYHEGDELSMHQKLVNGLYDFVISSDAAYPAFKALFNLDEDYVSLTVEEAAQVFDPYVYLLLENSERGKKLKDDVNGAIRTLTGNGAISRITRQYLSADLSVKK
ncbi:MAG: transporter substrate-binding domain-containing protein, partial [Treponema sp.]|nr:transporter substrate-binding domain-containing protein [Treponema sp.]